MSQFYQTLFLSFKFHVELESPKRENNVVPIQWQSFLVNKPDKYAFTGKEKFGRIAFRHVYFMRTEIKMKD